MCPIDPSERIAWIRETHAASLLEHIDPHPEGWDVDQCARCHADATFEGSSRAFVCDLLRALDVATEERDEHARRSIAANNELSAVSRAHDGDAGLSDFDLSFPLVRAVADLVAERDAALARAEAAEQQNEGLRGERDAERGIAQDWERRHEAINADLSRLRAERTWQPIATHDGSRAEVLLWWPYWSSRPTVGYWKNDRWIAENALSDCSQSVGPTHWQPLPSAPVEPREDGSKP